MRLPIAVGALAAIAAGASAFAQGISDPGERAFQYCYSCHSVEPNQTEVLSGPNLNGVIGRPIASKAGFQVLRRDEELRRRQGVDARADRAIHPGPEGYGPRYRDGEAARTA